MIEHGADDVNDENDGIEDLEEIKQNGYFNLNFWNSTSNTNSTSNFTRSQQLTKFIDDLKHGFSLNSAITRFQTIKAVLETSINEAIDNNVDYSDEEDEEEIGDEIGDETDHETDDKYEPKIIKPVQEPKVIPNIDQIIIPQDKNLLNDENNETDEVHDSNEVNEENRKSEMSDYNHLVNNLTKTELNDEMFLRSRIIKIKNLLISEESKNKLIQKLMSSNYKEEDYSEDTANTNINSNNRSNHNKFQENKRNHIQIDNDAKFVIYHDEENEVLGCEHYSRNCKMKCPICFKWFGCPICHENDESSNNHEFKRENCNEIMCLKCFNIQSPQEYCSNCDEKFANYYCSICKLYDNDEDKDIYHCNDCGICRLGLGLGQDFFHCNGCNACLSVELQDDHKCIERATQCDCPICGEFMFTSIKPVVFMSCGHAIHQSCYDDHSKHSYKCPTCQKTVINMEAQFRVLDMEISSQPLPEPYCNWKCVIKCNDCNGKSIVNYHILGLKCDHCKSYNTVQLKIKKDDSNDDADGNNILSDWTDDENLNGLRNNILNTNYNIESQQEVLASAPAAGASSLPLASSQAQSQSHFQSQKSAAQQRQPPSNSISQTLLNNFDNYVNNLKDDSSDSDGEFEDQDFLRVGRLKQRFGSDIDGGLTVLRDFINSNIIIDQFNSDDDDDYPADSNEGADGKEND